MTENGEELQRETALAAAAPKLVAEDTPNQTSDRLSEDRQNVLTETQLEQPQLKIAKPDDLVGKVLGGVYVIESFLGAGAVSTVYKARHLILNHFVAIKVIRREHIHGEQTLLRFVQEAKATTNLSHPNIVPSREFGLDQDGYPYLVMDFVDGQSLQEVLKRDGKLEPKRAIGLISQICSGLAYTHKHGVIHRDIKPGNIIITHDTDGTESARLVDFGIAKLTTASEGNDLTQTGDVFGTPLYMSPEQCRGKKLDARSDIYSLGCVLYEMLCGHPPYQADNILETMMLHLNSTGPEFGKEFPGGLEKPLSGALQPDPMKRYANVELFQHDIEAADPKAKRKPKLRVTKGQRDWLLTAILVAATLAFGYVQLAPMETGRKIDGALTNWTESKWSDSKQSVQSLLREVEGCPVNNSTKAHWLLHLGIKCKIADAHSTTVGLPEAITCFATALKYKDLSPEVTGALNKQLADCYHRLARYQDAQPFYKTAVQLRRQMSGPNQQLLINALSAQASNFLSDKKVDQAQAAAKEALELAQKNNDAQRRVKCLLILGRIAEEQGQLNDALELFTSAIAAESKMPSFDKSGVSSLAHDIAILHQLGKHADAQKLTKLLDCAGANEDDD